MGTMQHRYSGNSFMTCGYDKNIKLTASDIETDLSKDQSEIKTMGISDCSFRQTIS